MRLEVSLEYFTSPGEELFMILSDGKTVAMRSCADGRWAASFDVPSSVKTLEYSFELHRDGRCVRTEWAGRRIPLQEYSSGNVAAPSGLANGGAVLPGREAGETASGTVQRLEIRDRWQERPEDSPFWTKAFTQVIFKRRRRASGGRGNVTFSVPCAFVRKEYALAITGSGFLFDEWKRFVPMCADGFPFWNVSLDAGGPFEFKFVILDLKTGKPVVWEAGPNHFFAGTLSHECRSVIRDVVPEFETAPWRGAGTAVPVFSLRSESGFGVGEFKDIRILADWAALTGQSVIQILPVNDTAMTGDRTDSYPYNANSTFALHPQFIHLPDAGVRPDEKYKALQRELNALPFVDYERVNREKTRLLKNAFSAAGEEVMSGKEYKSFYSSNKDWLVPYAVFCVLRDINGTPDFRKWKSLSEYSDSKAKAFFRRHKAETEFYCYVQFCLDAQLKDAVEYAHSKGIVIKGDLPIGISRTSVDAWMFPRLFNLDSQAGAPPDAFSSDGQNWGFPTYNWEEMAKDGYAWWKARLRKMSEYFDAFRIDHILGFFRIWEIPLGVRAGLEGHFNPALPYSADELRDRELNPDSRLFVQDPHRPGWYHPFIASRGTEDFRALEDRLKSVYEELYDDFFYRRHNDFWKESAMRKLPALLDSTEMLACGEDLGMIPACVPEVMRKLRILSLEIQRMPKSPGRTFDDPASYPYLSVCSTGTHDTSTLRGWWEENREMSERFFHEVLRCEGAAPYSCEPWICKMIVRRHLESPSMLCVLPLQDWMSVDGEIRYQGSPEDERINIPAVRNHYWRWRMHIPLEELLGRSAFNSELKTMISASGRG